MNNLLLGIQLHLQTEKVRKPVSLCENLFFSQENFTYDDSLSRDQLHNSQMRRRTYLDVVSSINIYTGLNNVRLFRKKNWTPCSISLETPLCFLLHTAVWCLYIAVRYASFYKSLTLEYQRHVTFHNYLLLPSSPFHNYYRLYWYNVRNNRQDWVEQSKIYMFYAADAIYMWNAVSTS